MKYKDFVAYLIFTLMLPVNAVKILFLGIFSSIFVIVSYLKFDKFAYLNLKIILSISYCANIIEKYFIYFLSCLFYWPAFSTYSGNKKLIKFFKENIKTGKIKFQGLPECTRNAILKKGFFEVLSKIIPTFSILPTYRHTFFNNPFLFKYKIYYTNQSTHEFSDVSRMCKIIESYIGDPQFIFNNEKKSGKIKLNNIYFLPNYSNDVTDKIIDYNNVGLQIYTIAALIFLETTVKSPDELYENISNKKITQNTITNDKTHPIYQKINNLGAQLIKENDFDYFDRYQLLDLAVPYDSMYHIITGKVEVNVKKENVLEHPMLCLTHDGKIMEKQWGRINHLFNDVVIKYLESLDYRRAGI